MSAAVKRPRVLLSGPVPPGLQARLDGMFDSVVLSAQPDPAAFLKSEAPSFEALLTTGKTGADAALINALPSIRAISHFGVGYDNVDVGAASGRGIPVSNTPDVLNDCVADLAIGLLLDTARGISASDRFVRRGEWPKGMFPLATRVSGKKLGIAGLGRIGRTIAKRAQAFDMDIRYFSRTPVASVEYKHEPSLVELARWCDFLMVVVAGGASTRNLVSREVLDALGPQGFLVNVSRGTVVDQQALVEALQARRIAGAGLDVFADEPNVPAELMTMDNVVLLPHVASATHETRKAMGDLVFDNLRSYFETGRLLTPVPAP